MLENPQEKPLTVTLAAADWQIVQVALYELPAKTSLPVISRLQSALQEAQKPNEVVPLKGKA